MEYDVVFFPLDLIGLTIGRLSGMHGLFQVYLPVNAIPAKLLHNHLGSHASQRAESVNWCSPVFKEAQPKPPSRESVSFSFEIK